MEYSGNRSRLQRGNPNKSPWGCSTCPDAFRSPGSWPHPAAPQNEEPCRQSAPAQNNCPCRQPAPAQNNCPCRQPAPVRKDDACGHTALPENDCPCRQYTSGQNDAACRPQLPYGISYVPMQTFCQLYPPEKALMVGTIFIQLDYPFTAACCKGGRL